MNENFVYGLAVNVLELSAVCVERNLLTLIKISSKTYAHFLRLTYVFNLFLQVVPRMTGPVLEELDRILANKPVRQPMVSTLQQRWAATGGVPPQ